MTEVITGLIHLVIGIILEKPYPLIMYVIMPLVVLACVFICFILTPILDWIMDV